MHIFYINIIFFVLIQCSGAKHTFFFRVAVTIHGLSLFKSVEKSETES